MLFGTQGKNTSLGTILLVFGLLLMGSSAFSRIYQNRIQSFDRELPFTQETSEGQVPTRIKIDSAGIDLAIRQSNIVDGVWEVSEDSANYLGVSSKLGAGGNVVIYAHNTWDLFKKLPQVKIGDEIQVSGEEDDFNYIVGETIVADPNAMEFVFSKDKETLTLYTCTGFLDSRRFIVVAYPR